MDREGEDVVPVFDGRQVASLAEGVEVPHELEERAVDPRPARFISPVQFRYTAVTLPLHFLYTSVALSLHIRYISVTLPLSLVNQAITTSIGLSPLLLVTAV